MMGRSIRILLVMVLSASLGIGLAHRIRAEMGGEDEYANLDLFGDALAILKNHYVREVDVKELMYGAISGMVETLDAHSSFMHPRAFQEMQVETQGEFGGIGIEITLRDSWLTVVAPIEDTPAWDAGLEAGDRIIAIEGKSTQGLSLMDAVDKLRGKVGTEVTITILRQKPNDPEEPIRWGEPFDVTLVRDKIRVRSVRHETKAEDKVVYVRLTQFQARTSDDLQDALASYDLNEKIGVVLDLRNNPGGLLDQAIEVADVFLRNGKIVYTDGRVPAMKKEWFAEDDGFEPEIPVVVLINGGTASASEIVAGAIQDHQEGVIVGSRSFGKGSVQTILRLRDGSGIRVTTALYYTPNGRSIQAEGIQPDIEVLDLPDVEQVVQREEDLERHLELTPDGPDIDAGTDSDTSIPERMKRTRRVREQLRNRDGDPILERALDLLKGIEVLGGKDAALRSMREATEPTSTTAPTKQ